MIYNTLNKMKYLTAFLMTVILSSSNSFCQTEDATNSIYKILDVKQELTSGKDMEINLLFEDKNAEMAQVILRRGNRLKPNYVEEPILIHCTNGEGELLIENGNARDKIQLKPGVIVSLKENVVHDIIALPEVSILLIKFNRKNDNTN